jgi:hypothetical protein
MELELGPCAEFSLYHLMELEGDEQRVFPVDGRLEGPLLRGTISRIGKGAMKPRSKDAPQMPSEMPLTQAAEHIAPSPVQPTTNPQTLSDICRVLRSKNAGPYEITIDAIFSSKEIYNTIKTSGLLSTSNVAKAIGVGEDDIVWIGFFDPAISFKVTIPRVRMGVKKSAGGFMESDIHGSQEHMGLASMRLPDMVLSLL